MLLIKTGFHHMLRDFVLQYILGSNLYEKDASNILNT